MTAYRAREIAAAISDGIDCLAIIRSLKTAPPVADSAELDNWRTTLGNLQSGLEAVEAGEAATTMRVSSDLLRNIEDVHTHLSVISAGAPLPATLFSLVDLAWAGIERTMECIRASSSSSGEPPHMSIEEWAAMPEDEPGELVGGYLVEEEMADYEHETIVSFANAVLRGWVVPKGGFVAGSEAKLAVGAAQGRKPDLTVYLPGGSIPPRSGPIRVPPDIVIEVLSPTSLDARRDRVEKVHDYAAFGVQWYWLIDPALRTLEVLELGIDRRYIHMLAAAEGSITIPGCVDLTLDLDALWAELDRLGPTVSEK
jgi:Uma2 family endonuclease